ncbi:MAG: membrane protein insertase YidC [Corynebacterium sp.]|nr:membrane protein insertase YidC [Corynebacterium sp.]
MLNFIYWPISAVLWFWHKVFGTVFGSGSGLSWILAIVFLTFTVKAIMLKPTVSQMRSMRKMRDMQPRMQEIRDKYKNDQMKQTEEMRKLQREMGVNPLAGCLPVMIQAPVFIGLFHVLRSFNRTGSGHGALGMSVEQNRETANYIFNAADVQSFLDAHIFGVPISAYISMPQDMYKAFGDTDLTKAKIAVVAIPLIIIIAVATHFNARFSLNRQKDRQDSGKDKAPDAGTMAGQMQSMNKLMLWVFPATIFITGMLWHIGLLFYMFSNNLWTFFQQRWLFRKMDAEEEAELQAKRDAKRATAPKPGQKPIRNKKGQAQQAPAQQTEEPKEEATNSEASTESSKSSKQNKKKKKK